MCVCVCVCVCVCCNETAAEFYKCGLNEIGENVLGLSVDRWHSKQEVYI